MTIPFVLLFQGRSGSTMMIEALNDHPDILACGESLIAFKAAGGLAQIEWVNRYFAAGRAQDRSAVGFKTKLTDLLDPAAFAAMLRETNCRIVHLERDNLVKQAISWIRADVLFARTGEHNIWESAYAIPSICIDPEELIDRVRAIEAGQTILRRFLRGLGLPTCRISYERLLAVPEIQFRRVQNFLGVRPAVIAPHSVKHTDDDLRLAVPNLGALRQRLAGTSYATMCDEGWSRRRRQRPAVRGSQLP